MLVAVAVQKYHSSSLSRFSSSYSARLEGARVRLLPLVTLVALGPITIVAVVGQ